MSNDIKFTQLMIFERLCACGGYFSVKEERTEGRAPWSRKHDYYSVGGQGGRGNPVWEKAQGRGDQWSCSGQVMVYVGNT